MKSLSPKSKWIEFAHVKLPDNCKVIFLQKYVNGKPVFYWGYAIIKKRNTPPERVTSITIWARSLCDQLTVTIHKL